MIRVAMIDIDMTHAWIYANYINATGRARVTHVHDMGAVWPREHLERFVRGIGGAQIVDRLSDVVEQVDAAVFGGTRYDLRIQRVTPFLKAGKTVFVDKPAVGTVADVKVLQDWVSAGARLILGSSFPYCSELAPIRSNLGQGGPGSLTITGCSEFFEHGIHAAQLVLELAQARPVEVQWAGLGACQLVYGRLSNYLDFSLYLESAGSDWVVMLNDAMGTLTTTLNTGVGPGSHYQRLVYAFLNLAETGIVEVSPQHHLDAICLLIAAKKSRETLQLVQLADLTDLEGFDGQEYATNYAGRDLDSATYLSPHLRILLRGPDKPSLMSRTLSFGKRVVIRGPRKVLRVVKSRLGRLTTVSGP